jgi:N6-L-threonylcarbamoyladenine synthase
MKPTQPFLPGPVLGIETSCDETAAAVVVAGRVVASRIASQVPLHQRFGGVVPEIASRNHLLTILPTIEAVLADAGVHGRDLAGLAVTNRPGLIGALLVGVQTAKTLAMTWSIPVVGVHHIQAHCWAALLQPVDHQGDDWRQPTLPLLALAVSGGHTSLMTIAGPERSEVLGRTLDDAAGEALDKFGKRLGLAYPAGPQIDRLACRGDPQRFDLPRGMSGRSDLAMSFSGLKTAGRQLIDRLAADGTRPEGQDLSDLCASYQDAVVAQLVSTTRRALEQTGMKDLVIAGGVAANTQLRRDIATLCEQLGVRLFAAAPRWCTDNGAMIAALGSSILKARGGDDPLLLDATASHRKSMPLISGAAPQAD